MRRGARGSGLPVDPARVRQARYEAGLSLADLAGGQVSRTFIHFVEQGRSRPSRAVLALIARRTGRPISYFLASPSIPSEATADLATQLGDVGAQIRRFISEKQLSDSEYEAMKLLEMMVRRGAQLVTALGSRRTKRSKKPHLSSLAGEKKAS